MSAAPHITLDESERIYKLWCFGYDLHDVAALTNRSHSAVTVVVRETEAASDWRDWPETGGRPRISSQDKEKVLELAKQRLSQKRIAELTGVSKSAVGRLLRGNKKTPTESLPRGPKVSTRPAARSSSPTDPPQ